MKIDSTNENTLRELISLQIHLRDFSGLEETARKMLMQKPGLMTNWTTHATACYMNRNYQGCLQAIDSILKFNVDDSGKSKMKRNELNEITQLALRAYMAEGKHQEALDFLNIHKANVVDEVAKWDMQGRIHQALGVAHKAVFNFEMLLKLNSANLDTYKKIISANGITLPTDIKQPLAEADQEKVKTILDKYIREYPRVNSHLRIGLRFL